MQATSSQLPEAYIVLSSKHPTLYFSSRVWGTLILSCDSQNLGDWLGVLIYTLNPRTQEDLCEFKASQGYIASLGQESCIVRFCLKIGLIKKERKKR